MLAVQFPGSRASRLVLCGAGLAQGAANASVSTLPRLALTPWVYGLVFVLLFFFGGNVFNLW